MQDIRDCLTQIELFERLMLNFDFEQENLGNLENNLLRIARTFDSELAFIALLNKANKFDIPYIYTEKSSINKVVTISQNKSFSKVIHSYQSTTVNEEEDIDKELRKLGVRSMIAVPLPDKSGLLAVCNRKKLLKFNVAYVSYDVKICYAIISLLFRELSPFINTDQITRRLDNIQTEMYDLREAIQGFTTTYVNSVTIQEQRQGIVINDFVKERDAYLRMERELLQKHPGQFVGIYQGELIAINPDKMELMREIREKKGNVRAFIRKITAEQPVVKLPDSRSIAKW